MAQLTPSVIINDAYSSLFALAKDYLQSIFACRFHVQY